VYLPLSDVMPPNFNVTYFLWEGENSRKSDIGHYFERKKLTSSNYSIVIFDLMISMLLSEEEMINGCIDGNRICQRELYDRNASKMLGVCMRYAKDRAEAEDMLQEGFIKVFKNISRFRNEGSFEGWIRQIMVFTAINMFNQRKRKFKESLDAELYDVAIDDQVIEKIAAKEIVILIQQMPEGYRTIFNLYAVEGYTHREIGELLNIAEGTSKSQYSRAKQYMQESLSKHYQILNEPFREPK
jgi:RNA polymerase sigma factor (sigma-70 family)